MRPRVTRKWRPSLALVVAGTLAVVLGLPVIGALIVGNALGRDPLRMLESLNSPVGISASLFVLAVTALMGWLLWRLILRPLQALAQRAEEVSGSEAQALQPLDHYGTREVEALGRSVLDMAAALQDRAAGLRTYSDHVTHELKSPLTTLKGAVELLEDPGLGAPERARLLTSMGGALARMSDLLAAMQDLARAREGFDGAGTARLSEALPQLTGLQIDLKSDAQVPMPAQALEALLMQLCQNARDHAATRLEIAPLAGGFDLVDDGPGISTGNRARIFDPFFTTRRDGGGTGLGLAIAKSLVGTAKGEITLAPARAGEGARFQVRF